MQINVYIENNFHSRCSNFEEIWEVFVGIFRIWKWLMNVVRFVLCIVLESVVRTSSGIPCLEINFLEFSAFFDHF